MAQVALVDGAGYFVTFGDGTWQEVQDTSLLAGYGLSTDGATEYPDTDYVQPVTGILGPAAPAATTPTVSQTPTSSPPTNVPCMTPDGTVYSWDSTNGYWRWVPDPTTFAAMGFSYANITDVSIAPAPLGPAWPSVTAATVSPTPAPAAAPAASPASTSIVTSATSFVWGGLTWTADDLTAFVGYLAAHGTDFSTWAVNHPDAAAIIEGPQSDADMQPVPKSVGEALGAAIATGATPAEAAAAAEPLAEAQVAQGFGAPTGAALVQAATDVAAAYAQYGGVPAAATTTTAAASSADATDTSDDGANRSLQGIVPANLFNGTDTPAGVTTSWKALIALFKTTVPNKQAAVKAQLNDAKAVIS